MLEQSGELENGWISPPEIDLIGLCKSGHGDTVTTNSTSACHCSSVVLPRGSCGSLARLTGVKGKLCVPSAASHKSRPGACAKSL